MALNAIGNPLKWTSSKKGGYILSDGESLVKNEKETAPAAPSNDIPREKKERASMRRSAIVIVALCVINIVLLAQCLGHISIVPLQHSTHPRSAKSHSRFDGTRGKQSGVGVGGGNSTFVGKRTLTTVLTEPSVSCDLCPAGDDFCMELG